MIKAGLNKITKAPAQLCLAATYPFRNMTHRRVAEHGAQYLRWVFYAMPLSKR